MELRDLLIGASRYYNGDWSKTARAVQNHEEHPPVHEQCLTICDAAYPDALRQLRFPPWVLYYEGDLNLLKQPMITMIGSRKCTPYGAGITSYLAASLAKRYVLVSGLAKGVDGIVHETAMQAGGATIGVIGCGLDIHYPRSNDPLYRRMKKSQLILSEYPCGTPPRKEHFPWRNRILAALGEQIIVTQAALRSGTMLTVNEALNLSRTIWCVPYPFGDETGAGNNLLISQGANILYRPEQVSDFHPEKHRSCKDGSISVS